MNFSSAKADVLTVDWKDLRSNQFLPPNQDVRVPGFMVPLEDDAADVSEFLLIPYAGSCIHTPTPPRDQIVHVRMTADVHVPTEIRRPVWVYGKLISQSAQAAAFQMLSTKIIPLEGEPK